MNKHSFTNILFANPSFISGAARILDFGSTFDNYNIALTPEEADILAIKSDFVTVGNDIYQAIDKINR